MAKFNVTLGVQYVVDAASPIEAYQVATSSFAKSQSLTEIRDMATRFDGASVTRLDSLPLEGA